MTLTFQGATTQLGKRSRTTHRCGVSRMLGESLQDASERKFWACRSASVSDEEDGDADMADMIFIASAGIVGISTAFNAISLHGTCTAVFVAVSAVLGFILMSIRTLDRISWLSWVGVVSILAAIFTMVIAVGLQDRPASAPQQGPWDKDFHLFKAPSFAKAMNAVSSVIFATAATPAFFSIRAEMREPKDYNRCMFVAEGITTSMLIVVGCVLYYYCGQYVGVPAPSSAGPLLKRICYGLALPGLLMTLCIYAHLPAKYLFVRINRGTVHLSSNTRRHWVTWFSCTVTVTVIAYLLASAIPIFGSIVSFVGALFAPIVAIMPMGYVWMFDNWHGPQRRTLLLQLKAAWALWIVVAGTFIMVGGTYGAILDLISLGSEGKPWSCADNSV